MSSCKYDLLNQIFKLKQDTLGFDIKLLNKFQRRFDIYIRHVKIGHSNIKLVVNFVVMIVKAKTFYCK